MSKTSFPSVVFWPVWKVVLVGLGGSALWTFLIWLFSLPLSIYRTGTHRTLTLGDVLLGSVWLLIGFWTRWNYQSRSRHVHWYRWLESVFISVYITILLLCGGIAYWNVLLDSPWNLLVNSVSIVLFVLMWVLPSISYAFAKRLVEIQYSVDLRLLKFGAPAVLMIMAGVLGSSLGMHGSLDIRMLALAFLFPTLSLGLAQYFATYLWSNRPWSKEEE